MMGPRQEAPEALFCEYSLEDHVPQDRLLRSIDRFVDLSSLLAATVQNLRKLAKIFPAPQQMRKA